MSSDQTNASTNTNTTSYQKAIKYNILELAYCQQCMSHIQITLSYSAAVGHAICGILGHMVTNEKLKQLKSNLFPSASRAQQDFHLLA